MDKMVKSVDLSTYKGKKVLVTGHTGFKGSWMSKILTMLGAEVIGYSLAAPTSPNLYELSGVDSSITSIIADIRDTERLIKVVEEYQPEIVIHMAAQPIVLTSYENPVYTYETNVMGTVNVLEAVRKCDSVKSVINVTTDKVYKNNEWEWGYRETDALDGYDPYSNSKSCSELVTSSYIHSFFKERNIRISTCRAGNVIGGGDFADNRIIPDCVRSAEKGEEIVVRNPYSIRPYQHVLEPVCVYLWLALLQMEHPELQGSYNIGPNESDCIQTGDLVEMFCQAWGKGLGWKNVAKADAPHEANFLKLDCSKIKSKLNWQPRWSVLSAIEKTVEWSQGYLAGKNIPEIMESQIAEYLQLR